MQRFISSRVHNISSTVSDDATPASEASEAEGTATLSLEVKHVDAHMNTMKNQMEYTEALFRASGLQVPGLKQPDEWKKFSLVFIRTQTPTGSSTFKIAIKNQYIIEACKEVIKSWPGISWNAEPVQLDPELLITFYPLFMDYAKVLQDNPTRSQHGKYMLDSVNLLISTIESEYKDILADIERLTIHGEISNEQLYAIFVPGELVVTRCPVTELPQLYRIQSWNRVPNPMGVVDLSLVLQSVGFVDNQSESVGKIQTTIQVVSTHGVADILGMNVYPLSFHPDPEFLKKMITARGRKWVNLIGVHHKQYDAIAGVPSANSDQCSGKIHVRGRIMIDRLTFYRHNVNIPQRRTGTRIYKSAQPFTGTNIDTKRNSTEGSRILSDEDLLLTPTMMIGYSFSDRKWLSFNVEQVCDVEWNGNAFPNLVLPSERKDLLISLVEAHQQQSDFDDFIDGKGKGIVINLFGPPGVGKTFSAEATSEEVRKPLYVIDGGQLGQTATELDAALTKIFYNATTWKAIVLIDEADVFLEQRSLHELTRNAMVAVFLRHIEYFRGVLFLTTNRVKVIDEAFLSRIHVALHFNDLTRETKAQIWTSFLSRMGPAVEKITQDQIQDLAARDINGRQIKNATRTAHLLATRKGREARYEDLTVILDTMADFKGAFGRETA